MCKHKEIKQKHVQWRIWFFYKRRYFLWQKRYSTKLVDHIRLFYSRSIVRKRNFALEDKYFSQLALTSMTHLSVPNSCRSGVDIYWTNLSPARVLYFELLTKPTVRLNQIPKYSGKLLARRRQSTGFRMQIPTGIYLSHFSLPLAHLFSLFSSRSLSR